MHQAASLIAILAALATIAACAYYILCIASALSLLRYNRRAQPELPEGLPGFSILKPLKGIDPGMHENLRSHCLQDYPSFEVIFGVSDAEDPALDFARRLQTEFPQVAVRVVVCGRNLGANVKVSNLAQMLPQSRYEQIVVNDSDIRVDPSYLRNLAAGLADPKVGLVTCLYRGVPAKTLGSKLESLFISTDFSLGVLAARLAEGGVHFGLGSTLAFRRTELAAIGGFEALADYLADDYEIGHRISNLGFRVEISPGPVETHLPSYSFKEFFVHQLRWARTIRDSRRGGYAGLLATFGLPWALLAVICARGALWAVSLAAGALALRLMAALVVGQVVLKDSQVLRLAALIPVRDLIGPLIWILGFRGDRIVWRGDSFTLKNGKLVRITSRP